MNRAKENTWRVIRGVKPIKTMENVVADYSKYVNTYGDQGIAEHFGDDTFIDDMLYGMGTALDEKYRFAAGFCDFREMILTHLLSDPFLAEKFKDIKK